MKTDPKRRFTLLDGMILIAATAVGIGGMRTVFENLNPAIDFSARTADELEGWMILFVLCMPLLLAWTFATLFLRVQRPRPSRLRMTRQPGLIACFGAAVMSAIVVGTLSGGLVVLWVIEGVFNPFEHVEEARLAVILAASAPLIQAGVVVAWSILAVSGRWRSERSWIDRLGRFIGLVWVLALPGTAGFWLTWRR